MLSYLFSIPRTQLALDFCQLDEKLLSDIFDITRRQLVDALDHFVQAYDGMSKKDLRSAICQLVRMKCPGNCLLLE